MKNDYVVNKKLSISAKFLDYSVLHSVALLLYRFKVNLDKNDNLDQISQK